MKDSVVSAEVLERYAQALLSLAQSSNLVDPISQDVRSLIELLNSSQELKEFLANPLIKPDAKKAALEQILGNQVQPFTKNFLMLLVDRNRIAFLEGICGKYQELLRKLNQTVLAEVTSVRELTDDQKRTLCDRVKTMTGANDVELRTKLDPDLIGGVVIKVGSQVIDASLRGQIRRISLRLSGAT